MSLMVRKQIYIRPYQNKLLKRLARRRGISEAEFIREAIERQICSGATQMPPDPAAWEQAVSVMRGLQAQGIKRARTWQRGKLYEERVRRYDRHPD